MEFEDFFKTGVVCYTEHKYKSYKDNNVDYLVYLIMRTLIEFRLESDCTIALPSPDRMYCSRIAENSSCPAVSTISQGKSCMKLINYKLLVSHSHPRYRVSLERRQSQLAVIIISY